MRSTHTRRNSTLNIHFRLAHQRPASFIYVRQRQPTVSYLGSPRRSRAKGGEGRGQVQTEDRLGATNRSRKSPPHFFLRHLIYSKQRCSSFRALRSHYLPRYQNQFKRPPPKRVIRRHLNRYIDFPPQSPHIVVGRSGGGQYSSRPLATTLQDYRCAVTIRGEVSIIAKRKPFL